LEIESPDLLDMQAVISHYGVELPSDRNISYTMEDGKFYTLSPIEEKKALQAVRKVGDLLQLQCKLSAKLGKPPSLKVWAKSAGMSEQTLKQSLGVGMAAKRLIVATNIPLVYSIAHKHYSKRVARGALRITLHDLVQDGILGLAHAAELFDIDRSGGARFRTYAWYWIKAYINQGIMSNGYTMKMPRRASQTYDNAYKTIYSKLKRSPTDDELAVQLGISTNELYRKYTLPKKKALSLDFETSDSNDMHSMIEDQSTNNETDEQILLSFLTEAIQTVLSPAERELLSLRFGLKDGRSKTLKECSASLHLSMEGTRSLLKLTIAKLRSHLSIQNHNFQDCSILQ
jgi:RNA polymerase nonessential primary-like sigma factor